MRWTIHAGDALETLRGLEATSFEAVLCDPPYGIAFMGKAWDHGVPSAEVWAEVLRVLKPGAFCLAFGGTRTFHRLTCAIEDAGFEIRDCAMWLYGSGFPKSMDTSKALDKAAGAERTERLGPKKGHESFVGRDNMKSLRESGALAGEGGFSRPWMNDPDKVEAAHWHFAPATDAARAWNGYGTALKPAWEPCIVAMKPLDGTFAENALEHGVAGLNIEAGRIGLQSDADKDTAKPGGRCTAKIGALAGGIEHNGERTEFERKEASGRWPANLILDAGAGAILDEQTGDTPSRFFYCAKASRRERDAGTRGNAHPCLKPLDLCRYLASLILPPKRDTPRRILVPFSGSGSEMIGALRAGWDEVVGIEREAEYVAIAEARLRHWTGAGAWEALKDAPSSAETGAATPALFAPEDLAS